MTLNDEFQYYLANQDNLVKVYEGKYLVIKDGEVKGKYDSNKEAYFEAKREFELGTFLIQLCTPGNMVFTQTYHTQNVAF